MNRSALLGFRGIANLMTATQAVIELVKGPIKGTHRYRVKRGGVLLGEVETYAAAEELLMVLT